MHQFVSIIRQKFKKLLSKTSFTDVVKSAIKVSPLSFVRLFVGFLRSKMAAVFIGVAGVGILGQANQFLLLITTLGSLGMVNSLMQQMSLHRENAEPDNLRLVKGTVLTSQCGFLAAFLVIFIFSFRHITHFFFNTNDAHLTLAVLIIGVAAPFNVLASNYIEGFFTAYHRFDLYIKASLVATIIGFLFYIPAVFFYKLEGGLWSIVFSELLLFFIFVWYVLKIERIREVFILRFDRKIFKLTLRDGMVNLICSFSLVFCGLMLRQMVIQEAGIFSNGIYQFCLAITAYYTPFLTNLLWAKYFPAISAKGINNETQNLIQSTLIFIVAANSLVTSGLLIFSQAIIRIMATADFFQAVKYLPIQFVGDFWYFIFYVYTIFLLAMRMVRQYLVMSIMYLIAQYILARILIGSLGLTGIFTAYALSSLMIGLPALYYFMNIVKEKRKKILHTIIVCYTFVVAEAILTYFQLSTLYKLVLFFIWLYWCAQKFLKQDIKSGIYIN